MKMKSQLNLFWNSKVTWQYTLDWHCIAWPRLELDYSWPTPHSPPCWIAFLWMVSHKFHDRKNRLQHPLLLHWVHRVRKRDLDMKNITVRLYDFTNQLKKEKKQAIQFTVNSKWIPCIIILPFILLKIQNILKSAVLSTSKHFDFLYFREIS